MLLAYSAGRRKCSRRADDSSNGASTRNEQRRKRHSKKSHSSYNLASPLAKSTHVASFDKNYDGRHPRGPMTSRCFPLATRRQRRLIIWASALAIFLGTVWLIIRGYIPPALNGLSTGLVAISAQHLERN
jgi:hypothetical protein